MIEKLRKEFEEIYFSDISTTKGLEKLSKRIGVSKNSLRRFLGKLRDDTQLRISTLNLIAERLGYKNFQDFCNNEGQRKNVLDFELLDIYYGSVKGQGTTANETRFQNANYYFAQKIISDPFNLREFVKRFSENEEAMEYVLVWHPSYENIANENYQLALLKMARTTTKSHAKVFAYSFIYFGKFLAETLDEEEEKYLLSQIEKYAVKMRHESSEFTHVVEARYAIAKCISLFREGKLADKRNSAAFINMITLRNTSGIALNDRIVYSMFVTNILNILQEYESADLCFSEDISDRKLEQFAIENPTLISHIFVYRLNKAITRFNLGKKEEASGIFELLPSDISQLKTYSFDSKIYYELKYTYFATKLYPKRENFAKKFDELVEKTQFTYLKKI
ncbi:MAG: hypothetical protein L6264_04635 [Weeksellaceae bacterium]|nr:hypothetical protein [Bacteroidota bacterium]MCG2780214.1 hypothetical protein [Weeksellaceae bacterium]